MGAFPENSGNLKNTNQIFLLLIFHGTKGLNMGTKPNSCHFVRAFPCHFEGAKRVEKSVPLSAVPRANHLEYAIIDYQ